MNVAMQVDEIAAYLDEVFPQVRGDFVIEAVADRAVRVRMPVAERHLRPGGTVSGPAMFALADVSVYIAVLAMKGREALAVTTGGSFDFMRKPVAGVDLICECRLLKIGRVLAVGDCLIYSDGMEEPVARASMTYSMPPK
ncbi:PaaI family thioesterase [Rhodobacteraceae bacterium N5(2021)]|uniref:PaaI family thioesterase n=1 Tax=Gymnodinialimonas phycosphaerae TaxID=2841589 RepID=A0A975YH28_9RHOB|nr:PaaI family thioesterase [Gymnodinialimonas phycosphaerae]MBY4892279.1 PaaI family thioesterase [Gymnodinialimonas phycosphaerae]